MRRGQDPGAERCLLRDSIVIRPNRNPAFAWQPLPSDQTGNLLKEAFTERGVAIKRAAEDQYQRLFRAWASDPVHLRDAYDTERLDRLREIADDALLTIASKYNARHLLHAVRSLPLPVLVWTAGSTLEATQGQDFGDVVMAVTAAAVRAGRRVRPRRFTDSTALEVTVGEFLQLRLTLPEDLSRLLATACLRVNAVRAHRMTGKGMHLNPLPSPANIAAGRAVHDWAFSPNPRITRAIDLYMRRRETAPGVGGTQAETEGTVYGWMELVIPHGTLTMQFPALGKTLTTHGFLWRPTLSGGWFDVLTAFSPRLSKVFGLDVEALKAICTWLAAAIMRQAALDTLMEDDKSAPLVLTFGLQPGDPRADTALRVLNDLHGKGLLRSPRTEWISMFASACDQAGCSDPQRQAQAFVEAFTARPDCQLGPEWPDLRPHLFYEVDDRRLTLDLLTCESFLQYCFRAITAGDDKPGNARGALFEDQARQRIRSGLRLDAAQEPVRANTHLPGRKQLGDVDHCFTIGRTLIMLDMKSWQRTVGYHRGDYLAIDNRHKDLVRLLAKVERRAAALLEILGSAQPGLDAACSFLCVPDAEYISPDYPQLWYRGLPRVLTPDEIVTLMADSTKVKALRRNLLRRASPARQSAASPAIS